LSLRGTRAVLMTRACAFWEGARYQSDVVVPPIVTTLSVPLASLAPAHAHARPGAGELGQDRRPRVPGRDGRNSERNEGNSSLLTEPKRKAISNRLVSHPDARRAECGHHGCEMRRCVTACGASTSY